jgi:hypothetical protein
MIDDRSLALFVMLGKTARQVTESHPNLASGAPLMIGPNYDLATSLTEAVRSADAASEAYRLFFVFEAYLRDLIVKVLSKDGKEEWWGKLPQDVTSEIAKLETTEETKGWMALGSRDKSALMTYPQLLSVIELRWKDDFQDLLRDKSLLQEARHIAHLRNTVCHMSSISGEELERIKQVIRDWFRMVAP